MLLGCKTLNNKPTVLDIGDVIVGLSGRGSHPDPINPLCIGYCVGNINLFSLPVSALCLLVLLGLPLEAVLSPSYRAFPSSPFTLLHRRFVLSSYIAEG